MSLPSQDPLMVYQSKLKERPNCYHGPKMHMIGSLAASQTFPPPIPRGHCPSLNSAFLAFAWTPQACCFWALCPESVLLICLFIQGSAPTSRPQGGFLLTSSFFIPLPRFILLHDAAPSASKASFVCLLLFHQFEINFYKEGDVGNIPHHYP